jgi:hypothetical protein
MCMRYIVNTMYTKYENGIRCYQENNLSLLMTFITTFLEKNRLSLITPV